MKHAATIIVALVLAVTSSMSQWQVYAENINKTFNSIAFIDDSTGFIVGESSVFRTTNAGDTWIEIATFDGLRGDLYDIYFSSDGTGYTVGRNVYRSTDGGEEWDSVLAFASSKPFGHYRAGYSNSGVDCLVIGDDTRYSTNSGQSWLVPDWAEFVPQVMYEVVFVDSQVGYMCGASSGTGGYQSFIFRSLDGGQTFVYHGETSLINMILRDLDFVDVHNGVAVGRKFSNQMPVPCMLYTNDGGATWYDRDREFESDLTSVEYVNTNSLFCGDQDGQIYRSSDGGASWIPENANTSGRGITDILATERYVYAVGETGLIMRRDLPTSVGVDESIERVFVWPNPTTSIVSINALDRGTTWHIQLIDLLGSVILNETRSSMPTSLDLSGLPSGFYYLSVSNLHDDLIEPLIID